MRAKKELGQNWLTDSTYARRIVDAVAPTASDLVLEIGPGPGALTDLIVPLAGHTIAVELDRRMVGPLRERHGDERLTVVEGDVLALDLSDMVRRARGGRREIARARVVANLPYYISSPVLVHLVAHRAELADATVMLQREVVDRITARPGGKEYGALTVLMAMYCETKRLFDVPPGAFRPVPKVVSSVVRLGFRSRMAVDVDDERRFFAIVRGAFAKRRKTLENNLRAIGLPGLSAEAGLDPARRAETLTLEEFALLARAAERRAE
jgi:16S rRNA (adenine1518-N6/adenine1519-N6)-dimethyltransferase